MTQPCGLTTVDYQIPYRDIGSSTSTARVWTSSGRHMTNASSSTHPSWLESRRSSVVRPSSTCIDHHRSLCDGNGVPAVGTHDGWLCIQRRTTATADVHNRERRGSAPVGQQFLEAQPRTFRSARSQLQWTERTVDNSLSEYFMINVPPTSDNPLQCRTGASCPRR
jgi:hypothetical protein